MIWLVSGIFTSLLSPTQGILAWFAVFVHQIFTKRQVHTSSMAQNHSLGRPARESSLEKIWRDIRRHHK
jgi:hypothetical protein